MEVAFIAHASSWKPQKDFDFDDYTVYEYYAPEELKDFFREFIEKRYQGLEEKLKQF